MGGLGNPGEDQPAQSSRTAQTAPTTRLPDAKWDLGTRSPSLRVLPAPRLLLLGTRLPWRAPSGLCTTREDLRGKIEAVPAVAVVFALPALSASAHSSVERTACTAARQPSALPSYSSRDPCLDSGFVYLSRLFRNETGRIRLQFVRLMSLIDQSREAQSHNKSVPSSLTHSPPALAPLTLALLTRPARYVLNTARNTAPTHRLKNTIPMAFYCTK